MRLFIVYKSAILALLLAVLTVYLFVSAPPPSPDSRIVSQPTLLNALAPGAAPSPIHSRFGLASSTISAALDGRTPVRLVTTNSTATAPLATNNTNTAKDTPTMTLTLTAPNKKEPVSPAPVVTEPTPTPTPKPDIAPAEPKPTQPKPIAEQIPAKPLTSNLKWGVFAGSNPAAVSEFESRVSTNPDYLAYFVHWGNGGGELPGWLSGVAAEKGRTLVLFWEASDYTIGGTNQPAYSYDRIIAGDWDNYFKDFAEQLRAYPGEVILVPFSELNGNWTPWSGTVNGNTPAKAVAGWQHVHGFVGDIPNVQIGLALNAASVPNTPENQHENYYPGDAYVDIVGVDGFNDGPPWYSFAEIFEPPLDKLVRYNKPMMIFSFASAEGQRKDDWMREGFYEVLPKYPRVTGWIWFNQNKERNWLLWSDKEAFEVFKEAIGEE